MLTEGPEVSRKKKSPLLEIDNFRYEAHADAHSVLGTADQRFRWNSETSSREHDVTIAHKRVLGLKTNALSSDNL